MGGFIVGLAGALLAILVGAFIITGLVAFVLILIAFWRTVLGI